MSDSRSRRPPPACRTGHQHKDRHPQHQPDDEIPAQQRRNRPRRRGHQPGDQAVAGELPSPARRITIRIG
ncbi:hypothetical protein [Streptomyces acidiscabies]|uniref:hypothetical protein n=1 Tax=Streptomyces acidiscabies TaxID=42234 RepID=UPI0011808FB2|nr:hypothetical protein [Streptomyces acidiscabies]